MIFGGDLGGRGCFDGHECLPHGLIDLVAFFGHAAVGHVWPIVIDDGVGVGAALGYEFRLLGLWQACREAVDVSEGIGFEVGVEIGHAEGGPDGIEHEAENDGVGGAEDGELPGDDVIVCATFRLRPCFVQDGEEDHGSGHDEDQDEDVFGKIQHGRLDRSD